MKKGQKIRFLYEDFALGETVQVTAEIEDICEDRVGRYPPKASVTIAGEKYGIPEPEILEVIPAVGEQLILFA